MSAAKDAKEIKDKLSGLEALVNKALALFSGKKPEASTQDTSPTQKPEDKKGKNEGESDPEPDPEADPEADPENPDQDPESEDLGAKIDTLASTVETLTKNFDEAVAKAVEAKANKVAAKKISNATGKPLAAANDNALAGKPSDKVDELKGADRIKAGLAKRREATK